MADRIDKFTEKARKTLQFAQEEAQRFGHHYIGTEHILLGLVREGDGVAARVLNNLGIELTKVRSAVEFIIERGDRMVMGEIGLTPRAKRVIELAVDEARRLNHHYIGTEHLLLGLVREGEGIAAGVLESLGVSLQKVRTQVIEVLQNPTGSTSSTSGEGAYSAHDSGIAGEESKPPGARFDNPALPRWLARMRGPGKSDPPAGSWHQVPSDRSESDMRLYDWMRSDLNFGLLRKIDDSFLAALQSAMTMAVVLTDSYLGTDHIISAMLRNKRSAASRLIEGRTVDHDTIDMILNTGMGETWAEPFTYEAMHAINLAIEEATTARQLPATEAHLLLGIITADHSTGASAIKTMGITAEQVRALILDDAAGTDK